MYRHRPQTEPDREHVQDAEDSRRCVFVPAIDSPANIDN